MIRLLGLEAEASSGWDFRGKFWSSTEPCFHHRRGGNCQDMDEELRTLAPTARGSAGSSVAAAASAAAAGGRGKVNARNTGAAGKGHEFYNPELVRVVADWAASDFREFDYDMHGQGVVGGVSSSRR